MVVVTKWVRAIFSYLGNWICRTFARGVCPPDMLHGSDDLVTAIIENVPEMVFVKDAQDLSFVRINKAGEDLLGISRHDLLSKTDFDLFPPNEAEFFQARDRQVLRSRQQLTIPQESIQTKHLGKRFLRTKKVPISGRDGKPKYLLGISEDITERIRSQDALQANEERYQAIVTSAAHAIFAVHRSGQVVFCNRSAERMFGYQQHELVGKTLECIVPSRLKAAHSSGLKQFASTGDSPAVGTTRETYGLKNDGTEFPIEITFTAWCEGNERFLAALILDITRRKQAERALKRSESEYRTMVENSPYGIYRSSGTGRFLTANSALVNMLGYDSVEEIRALDVANDVYVDPTERLHLLQKYSTATEIERIETRWKRKDGKVITVLRAGRAVLDESGELQCFEMIAQDVTEHRRLAEQLRQSQKMEALGQLSGGIAHDFNNELSVILMTAQMLANGIEQGQKELTGGLQDIVDAANRAAEMTRQLVGFSRRAPLDPKPSNLSKRVRKFAPMLTRILPENIRVETDVPESVESVCVDPGSIVQLLLNVVTNARQAMPDGGALRIRIRDANLDKTYCDRYPPITPGRYVLLSVSDTGVGMDAETRDRIFDPFFTTKAVGQGTGLGMAMVYGLTKQQGGYVHIDTETGAGTTVTFAFPIVADPPIATGEHKALFDVRGGNETIMLVEDERTIRRAGRRVLESHGYNVLTASDGEDALRKLRSRNRQIDLIISDLVMPKMGGAELWAVLKDEFIEIPVIFASGHPDSEIREQLGAHAAVPLLQKPWTVWQMLTAVRVSLDKSKSPLAQL